MRNLKRALSLALALVMVLSMMVVGAGAVSIDDFTDADEIVNTEAVTTMVSLGVIDGNDDGSYNPTGVVKRGEMAKLIAVMLNGGKDPTLGATPVVFADTAGHWAQNYISYVANLHIIDGRGDGTFGPNDEVTGSEAAKMILTALGYRSDLEGFTGANWAINVQAMANSIDLFDGLTINPDQGLTRDNTAQMLYNAVQSWMVEYRNLEGSYDGIVYPQPLNGTKENSTVLMEKFNVVKVEGVVVANDIMAIDNDGETTVAGKARLSDIYVSGTHRVKDNGDLIDDVYPVALDNSYLGQRVVLYVKGLRDLAPNASTTEVIGTPILSQDNTVATTAARMKDSDAVRSFLSDNGLSLPAGGVTTDAVHGTVTYLHNNEDQVSADGSKFDRTFAVTEASNVNGTEFTFIDHDGDGVVDYIFKTLPKMAKVTVYDADDKTLTIAGEGAIDFDDIANPEDVAKDDIVLYYLMNETYYLTVAETVAGKVESYNDNNKTVTVDGNSYGKSTVSVETSGTDLEEYGIEMPMVGNTYTFYLDAHGNAVAWILGDESVGNYALVLASDDSGSAVVTKGEVKLLLGDGSVVTGNVNLLASANKFADTKNLGTTEEKEDKMAAKLADDKMANTLVTYVIGDNGTITIGDPTTASDRYHRITVGDGYSFDAGQPVQRATARYTFTETAAARAVGDKVTVSVNDSTLFFIRNVGGSGYSVVKGVSNLPTTALTKEDKVTPGTVEGVIYTDTDANPMLAKAVFVDADYQGTASYVYLTGSYTGTQTVNGELVYTYPVVFEDGSEGTLSADGDSYDDGLVYEYTVDSNGVATLSTPAPSTGKSGVVNGYVSTFAKGRNITLAKGDAPANTRSYTVLSDADIWNVEGKPYEETLTSDMTVALVIDADGFVKTAFVKDTSVTKGTAAVVKDLSDKGVSVIGSDAVFSGFNATFGGFAKNTDITVTYDVLKNNGRTETTKNKEIKSDDNGYITIEMPKNATSVTLTAANNVVGGGETPTGAYTITVYASSNFSANQFWVNGKQLSSADTTTGAGYYTIKVNNTDEIVLTGFSFASSVNNNATVTLADGVTGTVNKVANTVSFKVTKDFSLTGTASSIASTATGGDVAPVVPELNANLTLKTADGTVVSGGTVTKAEIDSSDSNKLSIAITLPEGYTANTNTATVSYVSGQTSNSITMGTGATASGKYTAKSNGNASTVIGDGTGTLNITLEVAPVDGKKVSFVLPEGYYLTGTAGSDYSETLSSTTAAAIDFTLTGAPDYASKVDVTYTVSGTKLDSAKEYVAEDVAVTSGALTKISTTATTATGDVVVTVTKVVASEVKAEVKAPNGVTITFENAETLTTDAAGATLSEKLHLTAPANAEEAKITYTITGATGKTSSDKLTGELTIDATTDSWKEAISGTFVATGDQAVVVTIDSVTYTKAKTNAVTGAAYGTVDTSNTIATVAVKSGTAFAIEEKDGKYVNTEAVTLTFTPTNNWSGTTPIEIQTIVGGSSTAASMVSGAPTSGDKTPVEITFASGELTIDSLGTALSYVVADNA